MDIGQFFFYLQIRGARLVVVSRKASPERPLKPGNCFLLLLPFNLQARPAEFQPECPIRRLEKIIKKNYPEKSDRLSLFISDLLPGKGNIPYF